MEDYKKKYEGAIKRSTQVLKLAKDRDAAEGYVYIIFPELKENKDEKIRKMLLELARNCGDANFSDVTREETIEYLEKLNTAEWTDDDVRIKQNTILFLQYGVSIADLSSTKDREECIDWLDKLTPNPKFRVGDLITPVHPTGHQATVRVTHVGDGHYNCQSDDDKHFLSLPIHKQDEYRLIEEHPTWKPTKEQLDSLKAVIKELQRLANAATDHDRTYENVKTIYEHLKNI